MTFINNFKSKQLNKEISFVDRIQDIDIDLNFSN